MNLQSHDFTNGILFLLIVVDSAVMDSDDDGDSVSFRMVLPSESHRKQSRDRLRSASESVSSLATSHGDFSGVCICISYRVWQVLPDKMLAILKNCLT